MGIPLTNSSRSVASFQVSGERKFDFGNELRIHVARSRHIILVERGLRATVGHMEILTDPGVDMGV
jgi:hypothetical protein